MGASSAPTPSQENLSAVLEHSRKSTEQAIVYTEQMLSHLGVPMKDDQAQPSQAGVMGSAFDLRTRLCVLNGKLEQLAALL